MSLRTHSVYSSSKAFKFAQSYIRNNNRNSYTERSGLWLTNLIAMQSQIYRIAAWPIIINSKLTIIKLLDLSRQYYGAGLQTTTTFSLYGFRDQLYRWRVQQGQETTRPYFVYELSDGIAIFPGGVEPRGLIGWGLGEVHYPVIPLDPPLSGSLGSLCTYAYEKWVLPCEWVIQDTIVSYWRDRGVQTARSVNPYTQLRVSNSSTSLSRLFLPLSLPSPSQSRLPSLPPLFSPSLEVGIRCVTPDNCFFRSTLLNVSFSDCPAPLMRLWVNGRVLFRTRVIERYFFIVTPIPFAIAIWGPTIRDVLLQMLQSVHGILVYHRYTFCGRRISRVQ